jgi:hypothetical protein
MLDDLNKCKNKPSWDNDIAKSPVLKKKQGF